MGVDRGAALSAATRVLDGLRNQQAAGYLERDLYRDASLMADHLTAIDRGAEGDPDDAADPGDGPDNPVTTEFLALIGLSDPTGGGNVWAIEDIDGRELKWVHMGDHGFPELHLLDHESDGLQLVLPMVAATFTERRFLLLARLLGFPVLDPAAG